jgi:hypothetical protein
MTIEYRGHRGDARIPGPLGSEIYGTGGWGPQPGQRLPGPLGNQLWDKDKPPITSQNKPTKAVKSTPMPPPYNDGASKDVHVVTWPLFVGAPALAQVMQAPAIGNCPVAAILAALAFTPAGRTTISGMVGETEASVVTDLSGLAEDTLSNPPAGAGNSLTSARYFTVKLLGDAIDVSDVLYTNDGEKNSWSVLYLDDPKGQTIWASIIEKALAVQIKGYDNFRPEKYSANDYWKMITGVAPGGFSINDDTQLSKIIDAAKAATRVPTIAASKPNATDVKVVDEHHGYAMMGLEGSKIKLYNPHGQTIALSPSDFRHDFQAILFSK